MTWVISILIAVSCLTLHTLAIKFLGERLPASFMTPAFYTFAIIVLYALYAMERPKLDWEEIKTATIIISLLIAGVTIGLTDYFLAKSINLGADISVALPMLVGGTAVAVAILGIILFQESVSSLKLIGILFAAVGIVLIHRG